jgi:hypothetical protein
MRKRVKVDKTRLERFKFEPVKELKATLKKKPELRTEIKSDFKGTLQAQGIKIDDDFRRQLSQEWKATIKQDIKRVADETPESENWYLKRVLENKPIKLKVHIDPETGEKTKQLRRSR